MPDLTELFRTQSGWVVVSVILIIAAAYVLRPVLIGRYSRKGIDEHDEEQDDPQPTQQGVVGSPVGGPGRTYDAILDALDRLHVVATEQTARGNHAEAQRDEYRGRLEQAYRDLDECERAAAGPVRDANRYADRVGAPPADASRRRRRRYLDADVDPDTRDLGPPPRADRA